MTPRQSVWFDSGVKDFLKKIDHGRWYENSTALITMLAKMRWSPNPKASTLGNLWGGAIYDAWEGKGSVAETLNQSAAEFNALMKKSALEK